ncbi:RNA repair domain-containing protein [Dactylosporangium matsuzakiense]|uniref:RNA repair domain-containing protein n=1 Tax=Dactylosporangium matsuzakiense TaxID=53360 RepID=UPI0021C40720|nr:RNA repair domain-containing protein [Dactylosporangium matsuzakiense]UWZ42695.1 DUF504 domain-containing protein [Dactylosporangium matsuzakiense]
MRPVQDVVSRIRYDAALDAARFRVGYEDRGAGIRETPLLAFVSGGDVPWHRVRYVKAGTVTVWDRQSRTDLVFGPGAADLAALSAAPAAPVAKAPKRSVAAFAAAECLRFTGDWAPAGPPAAVHVDALQVATFNVLCDAYDRELTYPERRVAACLELLEGLDADVIALHEVTHDLWAALLAAPWVRGTYCVSAGPDAGVGYGTALLSRWPVALEVQRLSTYKQLVLGLLPVNGSTVGFVAAHLTSDHTEGAEQRRGHQLRVIDERLSRGDVDAAVVLTDLNAGDDAAPVVPGYVDAWRAVHPHDAGFTFDPAVNPLAAIASRTGRAARLDRILVRGPLTPVVVERFADRPFAVDAGVPHYASDHFGVTALLQPARETVDAAAVPTSALVIRPPAHLWDRIQAIRAAHDPAYRRWMPHINLVYGFVPETSFDAAARVVAAAVEGAGAFTVRLTRLNRFDNRGSTTVWAQPETTPPDALQRLQSALQARFPGCTAGAFTPHLTLAKLTRDVEATYASLQRSWTPVEFTVTAVDLISRRADLPFAVRRTVALTSGHAAARDLVTAACLALVPGSRVHVVGSVRLGVFGSSTDLDLVWEGPAGNPLPALATALSGRLAGTVVPVVRAEVAGVAVDIQYATDDEPGRRAMAAVHDADALLEGLDPAAFRALLTEVRRWSRERELDGAAWGLVGGFTWAVLVAEALHHNATDLPGFLHHCATHPRRPRAGDRHAYWPVYSPTQPAVNTTRTMTRSTAAVVTAALTDGTLPAPWTHDRLETLPADDDLDGRVLGRILALEASGATVRPYPRRRQLGIDGGG